MSATDELRRMLDERGVAHSDHYFSTTWRGERGVLHLASGMMTDGSLVVDMLTPEQAIAATLGGAERTCRVMLPVLAKWWHCGACGEEVHTYGRDGIFERPNYCPNCGARVIA